MDAPAWFVLDLADASAWRRRMSEDVSSKAWSSCRRTPRPVRGRSMGVPPVRDEPLHDALRAGVGRGVGEAGGV